MKEPLKLKIIFVKRKRTYTRKPHKSARKMGDPDFEERYGEKYHHRKGKS